MATQDDYVIGEMKIDSQKAMYSGFLTATAWASLLLVMAIGYAVFTLTMGVHWIVALGAFAAFGIIAGFAMNLGGGWIATVIASCFVAVFIQLLVWLGSMMMQ